MRIRWRNLELPNRVTVNQETYGPEYGEFVVEPFERGYGHTVGNSLRRVLLSSLEGTAVTSLKIEGVSHEFSSIPGVMEDVSDIVLNFKSLLVRMETDRPVKIKIDTSKKGDVTGADILCPPEAEVVNQDLKLCTLSEDVSLRIEAEVKKGRGYVTAEENEPEDREVDVIYIDSIFSPVRRVNFKVENTRVGKLTNYDRLLMNIWTDGTVSPDLALIEASKVLRKHLNCLVHYPGPGAEVQGDVPVEEEDSTSGLDQDLMRKLSTPITELNLSVRASNCIESENIRTVGELVVRDEQQLLGVRNFGKTTLKEIQDKLGALGLQLGMDVSEYLNKMEA